MNSPNVPPRWFVADNVGSSTIIQHTDWLRERGLQGIVWGFKISWKYRVTTNGELPERSIEYWIDDDEIAVQFALTFSDKVQVYKPAWVK